MRMRSRQSEVLVLRKVKSEMVEGKEKSQMTMSRN